MNLPNLLSFSRILLLAPIILLFKYNFYFLSAIIFLFASITDYLDGYFARKRNQASETGALIDLLSDKIFISTLLIWMTYSYDNLLILISSILIISREISVSYLRLFIVTKSKHFNKVRSDLLGKVKTTFQMIGLGLLLISPLAVFPLFNIALTLVFLSAIFSWFSFAIYLKKWIV